MSFADDYEFENVDLEQAYNTLLEIENQLETLQEWASDEGYRAIEHKIQEALGRIYNATTAAMQYDTGQLEQRL